MMTKTMLCNFIQTVSYSMINHQLNLSMSQSRKLS